MKRITTFDENDKNINNYFKNSDALFLKFTSITSYRCDWYYGFSEFNTFKVNNLIDKVSFREIENITAILLKLFPANKIGNKVFNDVMEKSQFYNNDSVLSISDYSIIEIDEYIICFHLDLFHNLGITISSIYRKQDIKNFIKKDFMNDI